MLPNPVDLGHAGLIGDGPRELAGAVAVCSTRCCGCCCQWRRWCRASGAVGALVCDDERACHQRSLAVADRAAQPCFQNWGVGKGRRFARISVPCTHSPTVVSISRFSKKNLYIKISSISQSTDRCVYFENESNTEKKRLKVRQRKQYVSNTTHATYCSVF